MKTESRTLAKILLFLLCVFGLTHMPFAYSADSSFEPLRSVDMSFLLTNPKLPWGEDPFKREPGFVDVGPPAKDSYELGGIAYSKDEPMAVVNGKTVHAGDPVGNRKVVEIGENYILLKKRGSEIDVAIPPIHQEEDFSGEDEE